MVSGISYFGVADGQIVVTVKVDGTFDKRGLPDPLLLNHHFTLDGGKIAAFSSRLAGEELQPSRKTK
jgi:hypothetical protein